MTDPAEIGRRLGADEFDDTEEVPDDRGRMSFLEHLDELRKRILYSLYALIAVCAVTLWYWETMFVFLGKYFSQFGGQLVFTKPMGAFLFSMKLSVLAGLLVASPFIFSQVWLFVAPGLYAKEKRVVIPFVLLSSLLFIGGAVFAHFVAFPAMWRFFASYDGLGGMKFFPSIDETFELYVWTILGIGLVFQMPMLVYFLARFGVVTAKFLLKQFRYAVLIIVVVAAVVTPSGDPVTLMIFAAPMLVLYIVSVGVAWVFGKPKKRLVEEA
jgi:sec-independent protein translocase protein TatC